MRKLTFQSVDDCEVIYQYGDTLVLAAKHPWIFRKDGTYIARLKKVNRAWQMLFLPNNIVFMDGDGDRSYHYVSLDDGQLLWSFPKKGKRDFTPRQMTRSHDGKTIYYLYSIKEQCYVDTITLEDRLCTTSRIQLNTAPIVHIYCDSNENLAVLLFDRSAVFEEGFCSYCLLKFTPDTLELISRQNFSHIKAGSIPVICNDQYILFSDLQVLSIQEGRSFSLIEGELRRIKKDFFTVQDYDSLRKLLNIRFLRTGSTLIIDCEKRKIAAHYVPIDHYLSGGCLIGNEFWIGSMEGIVKRPFPHMDPFPRFFFDNSQ